MKKSKLTIAVLSACMLAATGGISLGAAALANAPEAAKSPESSIAAGEVISEGIKIIKRAVSQSGNTITFTYSVTPAYAANIDISATLSWNGQSSAAVGDYLTISHNAAAKTVAITKVYDFSTQAKVTIADSISNLSAIVHIDCVQKISQVQPTTFNKGTIAYNDLGLDSRTNHYGGQIAVEENQQFFELSQDWTIRAEPKVYDFTIIYKYYFSDSTTFNNSSLSQNWITSDGQSDQMFDWEVYSDHTDQDRAEDIDGAYGLGRIYLNDSEVWYSLTHQSGTSRRYLHILAEIEADLNYSYADPDGVVDDGDFICDFYGQWCIDGASLFQASALTAEIPGIFF